MQKVFTFKIMPRHNVYCQIIAGFSVQNKSKQNLYLACKLKGVWKKFGEAFQNLKFW